MITVLCCSVFRGEVESLLDSQVWTHPTDFFDSRLHMDPVGLQSALEQRIAKLRRAGSKVLLICTAGMHELTTMTDVVRVGGCNCVEILLGKEGRRALARSGAFALLPEWTMRWRDILCRIPGVDDANNRELFRDHHSQFVYLDTQVCPIPHRELDDCSTHFGLPYTVQTVTLDHFALALKDSLRRLKDG